MALSATLLATQNPPAQPPAAPPAQQSEVQLVISSGTGAPPKYAVPDFLALSGDNETKAAAATIAQVLWDDLDFEREFYMIPRDTYGAIPAARSVTDVPFDRWRELGADGLLIGTVQKEGSGLKIQVRLFNVVSRQAVFSREYTGSAGNPRAYAHTTADEIHQQQRALARHRAHEADVLLRPRSREGHQHRREPRRQGDLHRRLRRREPAAHHREPRAQHHADLGARRPLHRVHVVRAWLPHALHLVHLRGTP